MVGGSNVSALYAVLSANQLLRRPNMADTLVRPYSVLPPSPKSFRLDAGRQVTIPVLRQVMLTAPLEFLHVGRYSGLPVKSRDNDLGNTSLSYKVPLEWLLSPRLYSHLESTCPGLD